MKPVDGAAFKIFGRSAIHRAAGDLASLGAPDLYYINFGDDVLKTLGEFAQAIAAARSKAGLVLDMRGYPGVRHYTMMPYLFSEPFSSPMWGTPIRTLDESTVRDDTIRDMEALPTIAYKGPIVLLTQSWTVSAAETLCTMLTQAKRVKVIGHATAATNGNVSGVLLPGGFGFTFTNLIAKFLDGSTFHGVGIHPDIEVEPTAAELAAGHDPELERAITPLKP